VQQQHRRPRPGLGDVDAEPVHLDPALGDRAGRAAARRGCLCHWSTSSAHDTATGPAATGFAFGRAPGGPEGARLEPAVEAAEAALAATRIDENARLAYALLERSDRLDRAWRDAVALNTYALKLTPAELTELTAALDRLIRPYISATRAEAPDGADAVHLSFQAFLHPDVLR
jgi:hypothetical protein